MTEHAVALVYRPADVVAAQPVRADETARSGGTGRRSRGLGSGRPYLLLVVGAILAVWLVLVFGRTLAQLNQATERALAVEAETAALQARLDAGRREAELVQGDAFMAMQARAFGIGRPAERAFSLAPGAPPPPVVVPLGAQPGPSPSTTPLEAWLRLLLGNG